MKPAQLAVLVGGLWAFRQLAKWVKPFDFELPQKNKEILIGQIIHIYLYPRRLDELYIYIYIDIDR